MCDGVPFSCLVISGVQSSASSFPILQLESLSDSDELVSSGAVIAMRFLPVFVVVSPPRVVPVLLPHFVLCCLPLLISVFNNWKKYHVANLRSRARLAPDYIVRILLWCVISFNHSTWLLLSAYPLCYKSRCFFACCAHHDNSPFFIPHVSSPPTSFLNCLAFLFSASRVP